MSDIEISVSPRGFEAYGEPVETSYGHDVSVYESSAASAPHIWLRTKAADGEQAAHLTLEQAEAIRDRLSIAISRAGKRWES